MAFLAVFSQTLDYFFQILQNSIIFASFILKINPSLHVYCTKFFKKNSLYTNFEFSQKFPVKSQIFLYIYLVPIMYEPWKLKKVTGSKFLFRVIPERCVALAMYYFVYASYSCPAVPKGRFRVISIYWIGLHFYFEMLLHTSHYLSDASRS